MSDVETAGTPDAARTRLLEVTGLTGGYGPVRVLHGLDFHVDEGEVVVILGANGAGKTTTIRALCSMIDVGGSVRLEGEAIGGMDTADIVRRGVAHVPQGRGTFPELSVIDNLRVGAFVRSDDDGVGEDIDRWFGQFPRLEERRNQLAGSLSGGEQQMLAVARALMSRPRLLLLDEPSLGLAPLITQDLFARLAQINADQGTTMLIVEQNAQLALEIANRAYVLESGHIVNQGSSQELLGDDSIRKAYLGV